MSATCRHHPEVPAQATCANCRNWLCTDCLIPFQGKLFCAYCQQEHITRLQAVPDLNVRLGRLHDLLLAVMVGGMALLGVLAYFRLMVPGLIVIGIIGSAMLTHLATSFVKWFWNTFRR